MGMYREISTDTQKMDAQKNIGEGRAQVVRSDTVADDQLDAFEAYEQS